MPHVTPHFTELELACHHCGQMHLTPEFLVELERLRTEFGLPLHITSGWRCPDYNAEISPLTSYDGPHTIGAVDVRIGGWQARTLLEMAIRFGWTGIGVMQHGPYPERFMHLDRLEEVEGRPRPWIWSY